MILLRCYPKITDWLTDVFHINLSWLPIQSYGFFVACGFMAAAFVVGREIKRREQLGWMPGLRYRSDGSVEWTSDLVGDMVIICAVFGILGASFFNYLESPGAYAEVFNHPSLFTVIGALFSGLSVYGGMICAGIVLLLFSWRKGIKIPHMFDALGMCFILAVGIGRLGCQVSGDGDWGIANTTPKPALVPEFLWASHYAHNIANEGVPIAGCHEQCCMTLPIPVYPTPIYEFFECVLIFFVLYLLRKSLTNKPGMLFFVFAVLTGVQRYTIEQIRFISDRELTYILGHGFRQAELISMAMVVTGISALFWLYLYYQKHPAVIPVPLALPDGNESPMHDPCNDETERPVKGDNESE